MSVTARLRTIVLLILSITVVVQSTRADEPDQSAGALLTLDRIFSSSDFSGQSFSARWVVDPAGYIRTESEEGWRTQHRLAATAIQGEANSG